MLVRRIGELNVVIQELLEGVFFMRRTVAHPVGVDAENIADRLNLPNPIHSVQEVQGVVVLPQDSPLNARSLIFYIIP